MTRCSTSLQHAILALLVLFGAQAALPHTHAATRHDTEICTGHLADHGAPSEDHAGACPQCRTPNRTRVIAASVSSDARIPSQPSTDAQPQPAPLHAQSFALATAGPRAPPLPA